MQSTRSVGVASTSGRVSSSSSVAAPQRVRTGRARVARVQAFVDPDSSLQTIQTVSQVVTTCCIAAGAFMLLSKPGESLPEQDRLDSRNSQPCPVCGGSGFEECLCSRWSDGDAGCNSCSKTGYMRCRGCGGGGTAVPLMVRARK